MPDSQFRVLLFSSANLFDALSNRHCDKDEVGAQRRAQYLYTYLAQIGARSFIEERNYTDGDYLEDFAWYYVRCHESYDRNCKRLHFFGTELSDEVVEKLIRNELPPDNTSSIVDSYLGFAVARPLPSAIVGRSVLKVYPSDGGRRHYPAIRDYEVNLYGVPLVVEGLPYQEQDSVLAACATVALWSAFHKTSELFGTPSPRPASITRAANRAGHRGRPVPSHGLQIEEMCHAVRDIGLEPELVECYEKNVPLISLAYGHLRMGLPVVLIVDIENRGLHAITLTGYSLKDSRVHAKEVSAPNDCIPMVGLRIDKFYGHDDQIGPYASLAIGPSTATYPVLFSGSWVDEATGKQLEMRPEALLIPVYNKIRVTFLDILEWLTLLTNNALSLIVSDPSQTLEWDLYLITSNKYKKELRGLPSFPEREKLLHKPQPRFVWRAELRVAGKLVLELLADATDMARSFPIREVIWHDTKFRAVATILLSAPAMQASLSEGLGRRFLNFLKDRI